MNRFDVKRVSSRLMMIKIIVGEVVVTAFSFSVYTPQTGLTMAEKELFCDSLQNLVQNLVIFEKLL